MFAEELSWLEFKGCTPPHFAPVETHASGNHILKSTYNIIALITTVVLLVVLGIVVSFTAFRQIEEAGDARMHVLAVINSANDLLSELKDAETGQRGYVLTGDIAFLEPYLAVRGGIAAHLAALRQLTRKRDASRHVDAVAPLIESRMTMLAQVVALRHNNDTKAAGAIVENGQGKALMDAIRMQMSGMSG